jgi:lipopolysaccharide transport system ATP-binding protein
MNWIVKVDNLSKVYRLGAGATQHGTLYEQIAKKIKNILPGQRNKQDDLNEAASSEKDIISAVQMKDLPPGFFWALRDISFEVKPGERIGLIGQNGSGKSTLLKILSRITTQSHGEFRYRGHLISLLEVGTGFHPELTGRENIFLNAAINGMSRQQIKARFKDIVEFSELGSQIDTPVKRYSSGMYMRLAFSVAAFLESDILLIDEVLAVGDQDFQKKCKEKMLEVANDGRSVIFVSHDMDAVRSICKKTIEMSHGKIIGIKDIILDAPPAHVEQWLSHSDSENTRADTNPGAEKQWPEESIDDGSCIDSAKLLRARLINDEGNLVNQFTVNENITVEMQVQVQKIETRLAIRVDLESKEKIKICSMMNHQQPANRFYNPGVYKESVVIPKEFLNEGEFSLSIHVQDMDNLDQSIEMQQCLNFQIKDDDSPLGVRGDWAGEWPHALLRPRMTWNTKRETSTHTAEAECMIQ